LARVDGSPRPGKCALVPFPRQAPRSVQVGRSSASRSVTAAFVDVSRSRLVKRSWRSRLYRWLASRGLGFGQDTERPASNPEPPADS
jgi:hypothetical protein